VTLDRWERLRALGAVAADPAAAAALGLPPCGTGEHAEVFAFNCPPYASAYLGGGTARLAAYWTATGLDRPAEPDHLSVLLGLYAQLGQAGAGSKPGGLRRAQSRSRRHLAVVPAAPGDRVQQWWADRAARTARVLRGDYQANTRVSSAD
jgi:hypothetical protein